MNFRALFEVDSWEILRGLLWGIAVSFLMLISSGVYGEDAGQLGQVYDLGLGAHASGMGNAVVGMGDDISTVYWNPGAMPSVPYSAISFSQQELFVQTSHQTMALLWNYGNLSLGASYLALQSEGFEGYDSDGEYIGDFSVGENSVATSLGYEFHPLLSLGIQAKQFQQTIWDYSNSLTGFDIGLFSRFTDNWRLGATMQNVTSSGEVEALPPGYRFGSSVWFYDQQIRLALDLESVEGRDRAYHYGMEFVDRRAWPFQRTLSARGGVDDGDLTFGVSLTVNQNLKFDYVLRDHDIDLISQFGFSYRWGVKTRVEREQEEVEPGGVKGEYPDLPEIQLNSRRREIGLNVDRRMLELTRSLIENSPEISRDSQNYFEQFLGYSTSDEELNPHVEEKFVIPEFTEQDGK